MRQSIFALFIFCLIFAVGCKQKSTLEKAGERVDEVIDNVSEGDPPLKKKGPAEKFESFRQVNDGLELN